MVSQDLVLKIMSEQPLKIWTVPEIASFVFKNEHRALYSSYRSSTYEALLRLEKNGMVKKSDMVKIGQQKNRGWVLV